MRTIPAAPSRMVTTTSAVSATVQRLARVASLTLVGVAIPLPTHPNPAANQRRRSSDTGCAASDGGACRDGRERRVRTRPCLERTAS
jgi:hypothetical protein